MNQVEQYHDAEALQVEAASEQTSPPTGEAIPVDKEQMRDYQLAMIDIAQANTNSAFDFARELVSAKTPSQLMDLCTVHAQKQFAETAEQTETSEPGSEMGIPNVYIEARPKGQEHDPIIDFAAEDDAGQVLGIFDTQMEAILWAKDTGHEALVTRARHLDDKNNPDHWRSF